MTSYTWVYGAIATAVAVYMGYEWSRGTWGSPGDDIDNQASRPVDVAAPRQVFLEDEDEDEDEDDQDEEFDEFEQDAEFQEFYRRNVQEADPQEGVNAGRIAFEQAQQQAQQRAQTQNQHNRATVGTKKARSLARRDQRRAYNEYVRMRADQEREQQRQYEQQYGDLDRLKALDRDFREQAATEALRKQREAQRKQEDSAQDRFQQSVDRIRDQLSSQGRATLNGELDVQAAQHLCDTDPCLVVVDGMIVKFSDAHVATVSAQLKQKGRVLFNDLAPFL